MKWDAMPTEVELNATVEGIKKRGIDVIVVNSSKEALDKVIGLIPKCSEVSNGSSTTLREIGFIDYLKSGEHGWRNLHEEMLNEKDEDRQDDLRRKCDTAEYFLGSVNAIARTGELVAVDASGSRVSAYPFAAKKVILVAGIQKIVPALDDAMRRVREHVFPQEDARAMKVYGAHSTLGKWVIIERELQEGRIMLILVKEKLGF